MRIRPSHFRRLFPDECSIRMVAFFLLLTISIILCIACLIGTIITYSLYQGEDPKYWTLDRDPFTMVFAHTNSCYVKDVVCSRRYCDIYMEFPLLTSIVFWNYSSLAKVSPGVVYDISNSFDYAKISPNITLEKNILYGTARTSDQFTSMLGKTITCFTDYSEKVYISPIIPASNVNYELGNAGLATAICSGIFLLTSLGMVFIYFFCGWLYKT